MHWACGPSFECQHEFHMPKCLCSQRKTHVCKYSKRTAHQTRYMTYDTQNQLHVHIYKPCASLCGERRLTSGLKDAMILHMRFEPTGVCASQQSRSTDHPSDSNVCIMYANVLLQPSYVERNVMGFFFGENMYVQGVCCDTLRHKRVTLGTWLAFDP